MSMYVSAIWLIANLVHPFMLLVVFGNDFDMDMLGFGLQFTLYSFMFSMPSLFLGFLVIYGIFKLPISAGGRYLTWLITAPLIAFMNYWLLLVVVFGSRIDKESIELILPAMMAVVLAILLRYASFFKAAAESSKEKNENELKNTNDPIKEQ